jgi:hypothetical protein
VVASGVPEDRLRKAVATHSAPNLPFQFQTLVAELEGNLK